MGEVWKDIAGFEGLYQVSNMGRIKSIRFNKERIMKCTKPHGNLRSWQYRCIELCVDNKRNCYMVSRLVGMAFCHNDNPEVKTTINHINGVKTDDRAENLEWVSQSDNVKHAYRTGLSKRHDTYQNQPNQTAIVETNSGKEFFSIREASRQLHIKRDTIKRSLLLNTDVCHGKYKFIKL